MSKLMRIASAVSLAGAMMWALPAQAGVMNVTVWQKPTPGSDINSANQKALPTNAFLQAGAPIAQFVYNGSINWKQTSQVLNTLRDFIGSGGGSISGCVGTSCVNATTLAATTLSQGGFSLASLFRIEFTTPVGGNFSVDHDDGVSIWNFNNTVSYLDSSTPTSEKTSNFNLPGAGTYNIWFVQANGAPTVLETTVADRSQVPEPSVVALMAMALLSLFGLRFMRRRSEA
jgi:hypothetical protein